MPKLVDTLYPSKTLKHNSYLMDNLSNIHLTARQSECLFFLMRGKSAKEIARVISLSTRTVEKHIESTRIKFNCNSTSELIEQAYESGFSNIIPKTIFQTQIKLKENTLKVFDVSKYSLETIF